MKDDSQLIWEAYTRPTKEMSEAMKSLEFLRIHLPPHVGSIEHYLITEDDPTSRDDDNEPGAYIPNSDLLRDVSRKGHDLLFAVQTYIRSLKG